MKDSGDGTGSEEQPGAFSRPRYSIFFSTKNMSDTLEAHNGKVNISGRTISNLLLADDIDVLSEELKALVESQNLHKV